MKVAVSSASFRGAFDATLTHLEWLDVCANELEVDGVVFDRADLPRDDAEYLAQLKKTACDLGLTVAALRVAYTPDFQPALDMADRLGAPILTTEAAPASDRAEAWAEFCGGIRAAAAAAKRANVALAVRAAQSTLCQDGDACKRLTKDVDSAWLRFVAETAGASTPDALLPKAVIAWHSVRNVDRFARDGDREADAVITALARFRGFVVLDAIGGTPEHGAYHAAIERFATRRTVALGVG